MSFEPFDRQQLEMLLHLVTDRDAEEVLKHEPGPVTEQLSAIAQKLRSQIAGTSAAPDTSLRVIEGGLTAKRLTDADLATVAELLRHATDFKTFGLAAGDLAEWQPRLREVRRKMVETFGDVTSPERATRRHTPDVPLEIEHASALAAAKIILANPVRGWRVISNADLERMAHVVRNRLEGGPGRANLGVTVTGPKAQATVVARAVVEMLQEADIRAAMPEEAVNPYDGDSIEQLGSLRSGLRDGRVIVQTGGNPR